MAAAAGLGYRPNHLARALATRQTSATVGLVIPTVSDPFFAAMAAEAEATLAPRRLGLISASHGDDLARQQVLTHALVERRVDALIVVSAPGDSSYLQAGHRPRSRRRRARPPALGRRRRHPHHRQPRCVSVRRRRAGRRRPPRVAVIGFDARLWTMSERYDGYRDALADAGIELDPRLVQLTCKDAAEAQTSVAAMLHSADPPTAVFAIQNRSGRGAIRAMLATGVTLDLTVFDEVADPDLLVIPPADRRRLGPQASRGDRGRHDPRTPRRPARAGPGCRAPGVLPAPSGGR